jgi:hypothetical protein
MTDSRNECEKVGLAFFTSAKLVIPSEIILPCSPETLFRCFEDADAWSEWVNVINKVEWTSPKPFAEEYRVTDLGNNRCRLVWTVAIEPNGAAGFITPLIKLFFAWNLRRISKELARYMGNECRRFSRPEI